MNALLKIEAWLGTGPCRLLSLLAASVCAVLILFFPNVVMVPGEHGHSILMLLMWGISAGFIHGVGFQPRYWVWRIIFSAFIAWPLMAILLCIAVNNVM